MRSSLAALTLTAGLALPTGVAAASTVSVPVPGGPAVFTSSFPASDVTSQLVAFTSVQFKDAGQALSAGSGCVAGPPVACDAIDQDIHFGNFNDRFRAFSNAAIAISSGGGNDTIRTAGSFNIVSAGSGSDSVWENGNSNGSVKGDGGSDRLYSFEARANLDGGAGDDLLTTSSARLGNLLSGGDDDDELVATSVGTGTLNGDGGNDTLVLDTPFGGFTANGGAGSDTIKGSDGADEILGGGGNDIIDVSGDGAIDSVDCGSGTDIVFADSRESLARNCEIRSTGPAPALQKVTAARAHAAAFVAAIPPIPAF